MHVQSTPSVVVGLETTCYEVSEDVGAVNVCAVVYSPNVPCPIDFAFNVSLSACEGSCSVIGSAGDEC